MGYNYRGNRVYKVLTRDWNVLVKGIFGVTVGLESETTEFTREGGKIKFIGFEFGG